jgi:hypothetical protein
MASIATHRLLNYSKFRHRRTSLAAARALTAMSFITLPMSSTDAIRLRRVCLERQEHPRPIVGGTMGRPAGASRRLGRSISIIRPDA